MQYIGVSKMNEKLVITTTNKLVNVHFTAQVIKGDFVTSDTVGFKSIELTDENIPRIVGRTIEDSDKDGYAVVELF
jgi:hypothetical protein